MDNTKKSDYVDQCDLSCWDCQWVDRDPWCTHPDQSLTISLEDVDVRGLTAADCKGFTPIEG